MLSAARRIAGLTKFLDRRGHEVTVITSIVSGSSGVPGAAKTLRTRDFMASPLNWRRGNFAAIAGESDKGYDPTPSAAASIVVPDLELVGWVPFALARARAECKRSRFDCVITSSPPQSAHLIGLALRRRGLPWVADFRDGWGFEPTRQPFPTSFQRLADAAIERAVVQRSDVVVGVTEPISEDFRSRFGCVARTITNGFDPEEPVSEESEHSLDPERFSIVYTGSLGFGGNSPAPLLDAVALLAESHPDFAARLEVVIAGPSTQGEQAAISASGQSVRSVGQLPREEVLALQRAADALVLFTGDDRPSVATGKLYEYLASQRPIIVIGDKSAAASIVRENDAGATVSARDIAGIRDLLVRSISGKLTRSPESLRATPRYAYPQIAAAMEEAVELAISLADHRK